MIPLAITALYYTAIAASALTALIGAVTALPHRGTETEERMNALTISATFALTALLLWLMRGILTALY